MNWYKRRIIVPVTDADRDAVRHVQRVLGMSETGDMDDDVKAALRGLQLLFRLPITGMLDDATAQKIDQLYPEGA